MEEYIINRYYSYPKMQIEDFIKMIYQAEFGNAHNVIDSTQALKYLKEEMNNPKLKSRIKENLCEEISNDYVLINLRVFKKKKLSLDKLVESLINTSIHNTGSIEGFLKKVAILKRLIEKRIIPLEMSSLDYLKKYCDNILPIHHSAIYHKYYKPSYRVIEKEEFKKNFL